jgi:hypothetical protein
MSENEETRPAEPDGFRFEFEVVSQNSGKNR